MSRVRALAFVLALGAPALGAGQTVYTGHGLGSVPADVIAQYPPMLTPKSGNFRRLYAFANGTFSPVTSEMKWDVSSGHGGGRGPPGRPPRVRQPHPRLGWPCSRG